MTDHTYNLTIKADTKEKADIIASALNTIYQKIDDQHLIWIADKIIEDPLVIAKVIRISNNPLVKKMF